MAILPSHVLIGTFTEGFVSLDAALKEVHTRTSDITSFPVEVGGNVTDHTRQLPTVIQVTGIVSATPILNPTDLARASLTRTGDARERLLGFRDDGILVSVNTYREWYDNMLIKQITENVDAGNGNDFEFEVTLQQVLIASAQFVDAPKAGKPIASLTKSKTAKTGTEIESGFIQVGVKAYNIIKKALLE